MTNQAQMYIMGLQLSVQTSVCNIYYGYSDCKPYKAQRTVQPVANKSELGLARDSHTKAFQLIAEYVSKNVVDGKRAEHMASIHARYISILDEIGVECTSYSIQSLTDTILSYFGNDVSIAKAGRNQRNNIYTTVIQTKPKQCYLPKNMSTQLHIH